MPVMVYPRRRLIMEITDVRVRLSTKKGNRVKAFATVTLDDSFVVRDMRIIEGHSGLFVAMPSRPLKNACPKCNYRNPVRSKYCAGCGAELDMVENAELDDKSLHRDVAHPITQEMRDYIHNKVIEAYKVELENSGSQPDASTAEEEEPEAEQQQTEETSSQEVPPVVDEEEKEGEQETKEKPEVEKEPKEEKPEEEPQEEQQKEEPKKEKEKETPEEKKAGEGSEAEQIEEKPGEEKEEEKEKTEEESEEKEEEPSEEEKEEEKKE
jgi:stage V sporulation protein G